MDFAPKVRSRIAFRVVIPAKTTKKKPKKKKDTLVLHQLFQTKIDRLIKQVSPFQQEELQQAKEAILVSVQAVYKHYLPEFSAHQLEQVSLPEMTRFYQQVGQASGKASIDSFVIIADQLVAEGKSLSPTTIQKLLNELILSPQDFKAILPLLTTPRKQRFPAPKYAGSDQAALEETEGGTPFLFLPIRAKLLILSTLTRPIRSSLTTNPEATFDLTDPLSGQSIRERIHSIIISQGINQVTYENLRETTSEIRSLTLYCLGLTPQALNQTIEEQQQLGVPQNAPLLKMLRIFYQDMISLEKEVGLPLKLVPAWAQAKAEIEPIVERIQVGTHQVLSRSLPRRLTHGFQAKARTRFLTWGIRNRLYELRGSANSRVRVYNRVLLPVNHFFGFVQQRFLSPAITRLSQTAVGRSLSLFWTKTKGAALNFLWTSGKKGLKKGIGLLTTKLAGTKIGAALGSVVPVIGNVAGAALGFLVDLGLGLLKKGFGLIKQGLGGLFSFGSRHTEQVVRGFSGLMQWMTSGEFFSPKEHRSFVAVIILVFAVLSFTQIFSQIAETGSWISSGIPTETRYISPSLPGRKEITSQSLKIIFEEAAAKYCVPKAMIMALSQMEAVGTWGYTNKEVAKFSALGWWEEADCDLNVTTKKAGDCSRGYCYDTCRVTSLCPGYSVVGPMQFEEGTWNSYVSRLRDDLSHEPHRCHLKDSIFAAAMKIKADSGTGSGECTDWSRETVRRAARRYCGSCGIAEECGVNPTAECEQQHRACGYSYCEAVWLLYNEYR